MEHAELPKLSVLQSAIKHKRPAEPAPKKLAKKKREPSKRTQTDSAANRKAAQLYDLAEKRRQREQERADAQREKERDHRKRAVEKAQSALDDARSRHVERVADIEKQREVLERRERHEDHRWEDEKERLEAALAHAKNA